MGRQRDPHRRALALGSRHQRETGKRPQTRATGLPADWESLVPSTNGLARKDTEEKDAEVKDRADQGYTDRPDESALGSVMPEAAELARLMADGGPEPPAEMISRLYRAFEAQVETMEARLKELLAEAGAGEGEGSATAGKTGMVEIDRTVKTLASLARTLTLLLELRKAVPESDAGKRGTDRGETGDDDDPDAPRSRAEADRLRSELAQRLGRLCQG